MFITMIVEMPPSWDQAWRSFHGHSLRPVGASFIPINKEGENGSKSFY